MRNLKSKWVAITALATTFSLILTVGVLGTALVPIEKYINATLTVDELDRTQFLVDPQRASYVSLGQNVTLYANELYHHGTVSAIKFRTNPAQLVINVSGVNAVMLPGMQVQARLIIGRTSALATLLNL